MHNFFQTRSSSNPQLNQHDGDATTWVSNLIPSHNEKENHVNSFPENSNAETEIRSVLSPVKPVNLLPQVPLNSNSYRKLSENEEHDCEIIGEEGFVFLKSTRDPFCFCRAPDQVVLLYSEEVDPRHRTKGCNALFS